MSGSHQKRRIDRPYLGFLCPECGNKTRVTDSRGRFNDGILRRREVVGQFDMASGTEIECVPISYDALPSESKWLKWAEAMADFSIERFEDGCHENGTKYWFAHQLMELLGYDTWTSFQSVITRSMAACANLGIDPTDDFVQDSVLDANGKATKTYRLSRFACFLISMNADAKKPEVAKAKTVLAAIADKLVQQKIQEQDLGRIEVRQDLKAAEKAMSAAAKNAGLERGADYAIFKDSGFRGMYNMSLRDLCDYKGLSDPNKTLYDFLGLEELAGNLFRVTQTTARIKSKNVKGRYQLSQTAQDVGAEVRTMMVKNSGVAPESLPLSEDLQRVKKRLKTTRKTMKKLGHAPILCKHT